MKTNKLPEADNLAHVRHSLAHLLAAAVLDLYPGTKLTIGPAVENGFYYDVEPAPDAGPISDKDLPKILKVMKKILPSWKSFEHREVSAAEARKFFADNPYKLELIEEIVAKGEAITLYTAGKFTDLCRGGHVENPAEEIAADSFALDRVAGAYWRGDEKNKMLTRIYGLAFGTAAELEQYVTAREEAKKRDHRKLGKELDLFVFSDLVGAGLPLWTEKGTTVRREIERFIVDEEIRRGYKHVMTPDLANLNLYKKSGHYPYYKDSMYAPIKIDEEEYMLRPMTCPHHFELYLSKPHSYRELPIRIAELAQLYRYEQSGELSGLTRVRSFCLADAHIICASSTQAGEEANRALDLIEYAAKTFGLEAGKHFWYRLSLGSRADEKKYFKDDAAWDEAEGILRTILKGRGVPFIEAENEAAFYGPKIDIQMKNINGKDETAFTVQYDFVMPKRFGLTYNDSDGQQKEAIVIHRSSVGAIERIVAFLIEHYGGIFPLWLSPVQVKILPITENHMAYARTVADELKKHGIRAVLDEHNDGLGKKIRNAKIEKIPYVLVLGDKEVESQTVTVESHKKGNEGALSVADLVQRLRSEIESRSL